MNAYKITILIVDHDKLGKEEIQNVIENQRYPNDCIYPKVIRIEEKNIGKWTDNHPLNQSDTFLYEFNKIFGD